MKIPQVFIDASKREIMFARVAYQGDFLMHSVYINLGKATIPIHDEYLRRLQEELPDPEEGELLNFAGPLTKKELAMAMGMRETARTGQTRATDDATGVG